MSITKAVITTAGFGTRFLPITKTIQKEMLPILERPLVDYVVQDLIKAGITEIIFVVSEHNQQIKHYYSENKRLEKYLQRKQQHHALQATVELYQQAQFTFVQQSDDEQYGTAVPVKLCEEQLKDESAFLVFMGDDFIFNADGASEARRMIELFERTQAAGVISCIERPSELLHKYGVADFTERDGVKFLNRLVEKPTPGTAPSNLSNISKYVLTPAVFDIIRQQPLDPQSGELYITETVERLAQQQSVAIHTPRGEYLDGGFVASWLKANLTVAKTQPQLWADLQPYLQDLVE